MDIHAHIAPNQALPCPCTAMQWYLGHNDDGKEREKPFSNNLLDPNAEAMLVGFLEWLHTGMPGYPCIRKDKEGSLVSSSY